MLRQSSVYHLRCMLRISPKSFDKFYRSVSLAGGVLLLEKEHLKIQISPTIWSIVPCIFSNLSGKYHQTPVNSCLSNVANTQTNRQRKAPIDPWGSASPGYLSLCFFYNFSMPKICRQLYPSAMGDKSFSPYMTNIIAADSIAMYWPSYCSDRNT